MRSPAVGVVFSALTLLVASTVTAPAQSLGEVAKREAARRTAVKSSGKVYTNDTVGSAPAPSISTPAPAAPASPQSAAKAADEDKAKQADPKKDQAFWKQRIEAARDALQRSETFAEALQSRINALTADFTSRDDPAQRTVVANDRQKALGELDRVKTDIATQTKAIAAIQEEARRAGVPPGWLR